MRRSTVLWASLAGFGLLYLAASILAGSMPGSGATGVAVSAWFRDNAGHVRVSVWLLTLSGPLFATFAALVRAQLPAMHRDVFFFGAISFITETAIRGWLWAGMTLHANDLQPSTARVVLDIANYWGPVLTGATVMMLAPVTVLAVHKRAGLPRWLGLVTAITLIEQLVETVTILGHRGFIAPGGPMNLDLGATLVAVSLLSLGAVLAAQHAAPPVKT
jgi:hypothetical protein